LTTAELDSPDYVLLGAMTHVTLAEFVVEWFLRRGSWVTRAHHALSLLTLLAAIFVADSFTAAFIAFGIAFGLLFVVILPLHEALHAIAYRMVGARDIRWDYSARMMAVWVIAHRFVADTRAFVFVALAPFVVINALLVAAALLFPKYALLALFLLLWHLHGCAGDWSLLNFVWSHRERGFWTYDDAEAGRSYFYGRAA
jgi:hypothetical protein